MALAIDTRFGHYSISTDMGGKMLGMISLSTSPISNSNCQRNSKIKGSICSKCYSIRSTKMYNNLDIMLMRNSQILHNNLLNEDELPVINHRYFRFESHGDLGSLIHLQNLINIAKYNPNTRFTLWTKMYKLAEKGFKKYGKPKNFTVVYSSLMIDKPLDIKKFNFADKIFTVFSKENNKVKINCGDKKCIDCQTCYAKTRTKYINERVK